jgi:hypothetical protein
VLGVQRPTNPGEHRVRVEAPGHVPATATVTIAAGERQTVTLKLEADEQTKPETATGASDAVRNESPEAPPGAAASVEASASPFGFVVGLRVGGLAPAGDLTEGVSMTDAFGGGGGVEINGGVRFAKNFTGLLLFQGFGLSSGSGFDLTSASIDDSQRTNTSSAQSAGLGIRFGSEPGRFGAFGELDLLLHHRFQVVSDRLLRLGGECKQTSTYNGNAVRLGGGVLWPVADWLQLNGSVFGTFGRFTRLDIETDPGSCAAFNPFGRESGEIDDQGSHALLFLAIGGDLLFGGW